MKRWILLGGLLLVSASAQAKSGCWTEKTAWAVLDNVVKGTQGSVELRLDGEKAKVFLEALNDVPPPTRYEGKEVWLFGFPGIKPVYMFLDSAEGCVSPFGVTLNPETVWMALHSGARKKEGI